MFNPSASVEQNILMAESDDLIKSMQVIEGQWDTLDKEQQIRYGAIYSLMEIELTLREEVDAKLMEVIMGIAADEKADPDDVAQRVADELRDAINEHLRNDVP